MSYCNLTLAGSDFLTLILASLHPGDMRKKCSSQILTLHYINENAHAPLEDLFVQIAWPAIEVICHCESGGWTGPRDFFFQQW